MRTTPLPGWAYSLLAVFDVDSLPPDAAAFLKVLESALHAPGPAGALNQGVRRLRGRNSVVKSFREWLNDPATRAAMSASGAYYAHVRCLQAADAMLAGEKPHIAFGMAKRGRVHKPNFSQRDNIAAYVEHRVRSERVAGPAWAAVEAWEDNEACKAFAAGKKVSKPCDVRTIRFARQKLGPLSTSDISLMADLASRILSLPPLTPPIWLPRI